MKLIPSAMCIAIVISILVPGVSMAQRRRVVVGPRVGVRRPIVRTRLIVRAGHPIRRVLPAAVVVRAAHRPVVVGAPLVFLPALAWAPAIVPMPARERLVWEDSEVIERDEGGHSGPHSGRADRGRNRGALPLAVRERVSGVPRWLESARALTRIAIAARERA